eukprot:3946215-Amphidinium_carterae.1
MAKSSQPQYTYSEKAFILITWNKRIGRIKVQCMQRSIAILHVILWPSDGIRLRDACTCHFKSRYCYSSSSKVFSSITQGAVLQTFLIKHMSLSLTRLHYPSKAIVQTLRQFPMKEQQNRET